MENTFFRFVYERQKIWYKRFVLREEFPWTHDEILRKYKIINVYRELDRCTLYLLEKLKDVKDRKKLLLNITFYRFFNKDKLYEDLKIKPFYDIDDKILEGLNRIKSSGKPIFNNAYLISSGVKGKEKHKTIIDNLKKLNLKELVGLLDRSETPEESFEVLKKIPIVGPFLACEIWTDLTYFDFFKQKWNDNGFVNIGPGAKWGLEIIYGKKLEEKEQREKLKHLHKIQSKVLPKINLELPWEKIAYKKAYSNYPFLSITNIEGALCEFRKYCNIKHGKGKRKMFRNTLSR